MSAADFSTNFGLLTGFEPFPWQLRLYQTFCSGEIPPVCDLPTGLGKTSVIAIWLTALADHLERSTASRFPRRLVYVVNRRTVVDQTTDEVEKLRENLLHRPELGGMIKSIGGLALSTLRGQFADNQEWSADPSRPAVICGTVDMIGSRLLFGGYRIGFKSRPLHAAFLGQDALLVHDEAHLEPAFQQLVEAVQEEQRTGEKTGGLPWPKLRVMALSATARNGDASLIPFTLAPEDHENEVIRKRIHAHKELNLIPIADEKGNTLAEKIAGLSLEYGDSGRSVLVFAHKVEDIDKIVKKLPKNSTLQLTGTLRGLERDKLVQQPIFQRFLPESNRSAGVAPAEGTVYLVCTSAGEVGVNISADHLACDLSTFDSMAQRFGRVNRFGDREDTEIHVVYPESLSVKDNEKTGPIEERRQRTLELMEKLEGDASPAALERLDIRDRIDAFSPEPTILPATDVLFDAWSMTTIRGQMPGRPPVAPYLHGVAEWEPPRTPVAWREEVELVTGDLVHRYKPEDLLEDYPLKPHELLQDRSDRVFKKLKKIADKHPDTSVWLLDESGFIDTLPLKNLLDTNNKGRIHGNTVLLPPSVGGLKDGLLSEGSLVADDVADQWQDENGDPRRVRLWNDEEPPAGMSLVRTIDIYPDGDEFGLPVTGEEDENRQEPKRLWRWYVKTAQAEETASYSAPPVHLDTHSDSVVKRSRDILRRLSIPDELAQAVYIAAELHDLGKKRKLWQRSIGNPHPDEWYAKSGKPKGEPRWQARHLSDYRHEFGSVLDLLDFDQTFEKFGGSSTEMKDLVLHLIAAHHGRARPHFPTEELYDPVPGHDKLAREQAVEIPRRFARLQRQFGRWGLAYLESLLRAADWAASAEPFIDPEVEG